MDTMPVIRATVEAWGTRKTAGDISMRLSIAPHEAQKIVDLIGVPDPGGQVVVGLARIKEDDANG